MRLVQLLAMAALALAGSALAAAQPPSPFVRYGQPVIALTHARLVDGTGAPARTDMTLVIRDGRFAAVGPSREVPPPPGAMVIDATGKTVTPGLVFMHEHMFYPVGDLQFAEMLYSFPVLYLAGGVTTARTVGTFNAYADLNLRDAIKAGAAVGPDLDVTGPYLEDEGLPVYKVHGLKDADEAQAMVDYWPARVRSPKVRSFAILDVVGVSTRSICRSAPKAHLLASSNRTNTSLRERPLRRA